jgi:hypothetical protein
MPYAAVKRGEKWILWSKKHGVHKSSKGKTIYYDSKEKAQAANRAIMANE